MPKAYRAIMQCGLVLLIAGCKQPLAIIGDGDVLSSTGTRDCLLEDYQAGLPNCTENEILDTYSETYTAVPRAGWKFDGWLNYCIDKPGNQCTFSVPANLVAATAGKTLPPLIATFSPAPVPPSDPNVVIIFVDDMGYADIGAYGATAHSTPQLDAMAQEGVMFTDFYVSQPQCTGSRASIMTGAYANRVSLWGALQPNAPKGIHSDETTLADLFKSRAYRTAAFGKWHLGRWPEFLPRQNGFDEFYGIPYSHDMVPNIPTYDGDTVVGYDTDQSAFTVDFTNRAVDFIEESVALNEPFFIYLAHPMPHVQLAVSPARQGQSGAGIYGDVVEEIDWSVGEVLSALKNTGVDDNTLVIFSSDNGPWLPYGSHAGSAAPLREGKSSAYEGGVRVPFLIRWPGVVPADRVVAEPAMTIDIFSTLAELIDAPLPVLPIDGKSIWKLITGESFTSPHEAYYFYNFGTQLQAMRSGKWKLIFPHIALSQEGQPGGVNGLTGPSFWRPVPVPELYDMEKDADESNNLAYQYPDVVLALSQMADAMRARLGDSLLDIPCTECRAAGLNPSQ